MIRFTAQDCPPIYLIGGTTALGVAEACALAISPLVAPEQRLCLVPYLAPPSASVCLSEKPLGMTPSATSPGDKSAIATASVPREIDRLLPGASAEAAAAAAAASAVNPAQEAAKLLAEYRAVLQRAWSGAPELATVYPSSSFYGHLQAPTAALLPLLDRIHVVGAAAAAGPFTTSLRDTLRAAPHPQPPLIVLTLSVDEMQRVAAQCDPEALKSAGGDVGVVAARMAANQLAALFEQLAAACPTDASSRTTVVVIADDLCRAGLLRYAADLEARAAQVNAVLLFTWVHELSPPALDSGLTEASVRCAVTGLETGLASLCASVTVGLARCLDLPRAEAVPFVPVDVALNVALMEVLVGRRSGSSSSTPRGSGGGPSASSLLLGASRQMGQATVASVSIGVGPSQTMVWGMLAEFLMDYVGRYAAQIQAALRAAAAAASPESAKAAGLVDPNPTLQFSASVANCLKAGYGVGTTTATPCLLHRQCQQRKDALLTTTSPLTPPQRALLQGAQDRAQRLHARCVTSLEAVAATPGAKPQQRGLSTPALIATAALVPGGTVLAAAQLARNRAAASKSKKSKSASTTSSDASAALTRSLYAFHTARYETLLARLAQAHPLAPYLQFVSLMDVDWGMYVRLIARAALLHMARFVMAVPSVEKLPLPAPTRLFVNSIVFHGPDRAPPDPVPSRAWLGGLDWCTRVGAGPTGEFGAMVPGMSGRRMATILEQPGIRTLLSTVASNEGVPVEEVEKRAKKILLRMGDTQSQRPSRVVGLMVRQLFFKVYDRVNVTRNGFAFLRRLYLRPRTEIVLVPHHRSYSDFLVMTYLLACMSLPTPHIVAGEDFLGMGKFAELLRGSGAFFMRRSFRGDPLYGRLFREYVRQLIYHGQSIEFFIEGTRSRTNKTMVPKLGLLKFVADALYEGASPDIDDVLIVPVSLSYDELLEAGVYAKELLGIPKPRESVPNMIKAGMSLDRLYGSINIAFGDPISLAAFRDSPTQCPPEFQPKHAAAAAAPTTAKAKAVASGTSSEPTAVALLSAKPLPRPSYSTPAPLLTALGWRIAFELQKNIVVTPSALVAAVLECFGAPSSPARVAGGASTMPVIALDKMEVLVAWLRDHLRVRQAHLSRELATWEPKKIVQGGLARLVRFVRTRASTSEAGKDGAQTTVVYDPPTVTSRLGVNMSANQLIHLFVDEAVVSLIAAVDGAAVRGRPDRLVPTGTLATQARFLTAILAREFPNFLSTTPCSFESWLAFAVGRVQRFGHLETGVAAVPSPTSAASPTATTGAVEVATQQSCATTPIPATRLFHFHLQLLLPHIEAAYYVASVLELLVASPSRDATAGVPARLLLLAAHRAAMELSGEEVPRKRNAAAVTTPTTTTTETTKDSRTASVKTVEAMAAAAAAAAKPEASPTHHHVLRYTSTSCNKEVLQHYLESMCDTGGVALQAQASAPGGQVYICKDAGVLRRTVEGLYRYVKNSANALSECGVPLAPQEDEAAWKTMKMVVLKHYNEVAAAPKL